VVHFATKIEEFVEQDFVWCPGVNSGCHVCGYYTAATYPEAHTHGTHSCATGDRGRGIPEGSEGPIVICTRNDSLEEIVEQHARGPASRYADSGR
jgi:hypothetical protein